MYNIFKAIISALVVFRLESKDLGYTLESLLRVLRNRVVVVEVVREGRSRSNHDLPVSRKELRERIDAMFPF